MSVTTLNKARPSEPLTGHVDVLIVGAGISGIGLGHYLVTRQPGHTFAIVDAATHGGPGKATSILVYKVYYDGFKAMDMGGSAAQSVILMVIVIALTVLQFRFVERRVQY